MVLAPLITGICLKLGFVKPVGETVILRMRLVTCNLYNDGLKKLDKLYLHPVECVVKGVDGSCFDDVALKPIPNFQQEMRMQQLRWATVDTGHNRHGPKRGGCCAPFAGVGTPSSTMWPGPRSTSVPSGVFIHPAIRPQ